MIPKHRGCKSSENTFNNTFYSQYITIREIISLSFIWVNSIILLNKLKNRMITLFEFEYKLRHYSHIYTFQPESLTIKDQEIIIDSK